MRRQQLRRSSGGLYAIQQADDDSSNHSTVSVYSMAQSLSSGGGCCESPVAPIKRARFNLSLNQVAESATSEEHFADTWYNAEEYRGFKIAAIKIAKQARKGKTIEEGWDYQSVVDQTYTLCCRNTSNKTEQAPQDPITVLSHEEQMGYKKVCLSTSPAHDRIGMERLVSKLVIQDVAERRRRILDKVMSIQAHCPAHKREEFYSRDLSRLSRPSRLFALEKARALCADYV